MLSPVQDIRGFSMKTEEYKEFLQKQIKQGEKAIEEGRVYTAEEVYQSAVKAALKVAEAMKKSA